MKKTAVILINVGSPEKPAHKYVRRYLSQFLNDPHVIDLPWLSRKILVNLIIIPFRTGKSTRLYRKIWTDEGSPLIVNTEKLTAKLNHQSDREYRYFGSMRYGEPSIERVVEDIKKEPFDQIIILPLFPQYASSTSSTAEKRAMKILRQWDGAPDIKVIRQFYDHPLFLEAFAERINACNPADYDHILFSYHGLPERHIRKIHPEHDIKQCDCDRKMPPWGRNCYRAACYETTRLIADAAGLKEPGYSVAFQSRLSKNWLSPFTEDKVIEFAGKGIRKLLVVAPSFVSDCLETTYEIGEEYSDLFVSHGGQELRLVESLNDSDLWVEAIRKMAEG